VSDKQRPSTTTLRTRREILRKRRRERQIFVFSVLIFTMGVLAFMSYNIYSGKTEGPFAEPFVSNAAGFTSDVTTPCPPPGALPLDAGDVTVRVLNSTDQQGLAARTLEDLVGRGFLPGGAANFTRFEYEGTARIAFGIDGVQQGYTIARHFDHPELVLDSREGTAVDVVLGIEFDKLIPLSSPELAPDIILTQIAQCLPAININPEPAPAKYPIVGVSPSPSPSGSAPSPDATEPPS